MASTVDPWLQSYPPAEWAGGVLARLRQLSEPLLQLSESSLAVAAVAGAGSTAAAAAQGPAATTGPSSASGDDAGSGGSQGSSTTSTSVREVFSGLNALSLLVGAQCRVLAAMQCSSSTGGLPAVVDTGADAQQQSAAAGQVSSGSNSITRLFLPTLPPTEQYVRLVARCPCPAFRIPHLRDF